jgi:transcriptional regulator with XRE-family HTH domain
MTGQAQPLNAEILVGTKQPLHLPPTMTSPLIDMHGGAEQPALSFGGLLRQLRTQARLTQEELAQAAGLSPRSVSDLGRGISRTARKDTAGLLAEALNLTGAVREVFVAAARGRAPAGEVLAARSAAAPGAFAAAATGGPPRDFSSVIGRQPELEHLLEVLARAVAGGVVVIIHAAQEPARAIPAAPACSTPRPFHTAVPVRGGDPYPSRRRRPGFR